MLNAGSVAVSTGGGFQNLKLDLVQLYLFACDTEIVFNFISSSGVVVLGRLNCLPQSGNRKELNCGQ